MLQSKRQVAKAVVCLGLAFLMLYIMQVSGQPPAQPGKHYEIVPSAHQQTCLLACQSIHPLYVVEQLYISSSTLFFFLYFEPSALCP